MKRRIEIMEIRILGPGCPNCEELKKRTEKAMKELGIDGEVGKITDIREIMKFTLSSPGLVVNGQLKHAGKPLPPVEKIKELIRQ